MRRRVGYWWEALVKGVPSLFWLAGGLTLALGGSIAVVVVFGVSHIGWAAAILLAVLLIAMAEGAAKIGRERDDALDAKRAVENAAEAERASPSALIGGTWTANKFEHIGQFVGTGLPGGAVPMTPGLLEFNRRRMLLAILAKQHAASHGGELALPKDWTEARLEELGEGWRLDSYDEPISPQALMADYEP